MEPTAEMLRAFALSLPGTTEEFPWEERVIKVSKKIFLFCGSIITPPPGVFLGVKLPECGEDVLSLPYARSMGYNLGKTGWVQFHFPPGEVPPLPILRDWVLESYRTVAPKRFIAELEQSK